MISLDTNSTEYAHPMEISNAKSFGMDAYPRVYANMYWSGAGERPTLPTDSSLVDRHGDLRIRDDSQRLAAPGHESADSDYPHQRSPSPSIRSTLSSESDRGWHYYQYSRHRYPSGMAHGSETAASSSSSRSHRRHGRQHMSLDLNKQRRNRGDSQPWRDDADRKSPQDKIVLPPLSSLLEGANLLHRSSPDYTRWRPSGRASLSSSETASIASERFRRRLSPPVPPQRSSSIAEQWETNAFDLQLNSAMTASQQSTFLSPNIGRDAQASNSARASFTEPSLGQAKIISGLSAISMQTPDQHHQGFAQSSYQGSQNQLGLTERPRHLHSLSFSTLPNIGHALEQNSSPYLANHQLGPPEWRYSGLDEKMLSHAPGRVPAPGSIKAKRKRATPEQLRVLQEVYKVTAFPTTQQRIDLGRQLHMSSRQVQVWFQNQRQGARSRLVDLDASSMSSPKDSQTHFGLPASQGDYHYSSASQAPAASQGQTLYKPSSAQDGLTAYASGTTDQPQLGVVLAPDEDYDVVESDDEDGGDPEFEHPMMSAHDIFEPRPQ